MKNIEVLDHSYQGGYLQADYRAGSQRRHIELPFVTVANILHSIGAISLQSINETPRRAADSQPWERQYAEVIETGRNPLTGDDDDYVSVVYLYDLGRIVDENITAIIDEVENDAELVDYITHEKTF